MWRRHSIIILDFQKAFDKVPHQRLLHKLDHSGVRGNTHRWITSWLTDRYQRVVLDGSVSAQVLVASGVPQGTVLGPLLFLTYINDISCELTSTIRLFADDALLYRPISTREDSAMLQRDINILADWTRTWQMSFNAKKCHVLSIQRGKRIKMQDYLMEGSLLTSVDHHPYLGVELSQDMSWKEHTNRVKTKTTRVLNLVRRNFTRGTTVNTRDIIYKSLVRPHMEYCSNVWDPYNKKEIDQLEAVQNKAARFVLQRHSRTESVTAMKQQLEWQSLQERRFVNRQKVLYKTIHDQHALKMPSHVSRPALTLRHHHAYTYNVIRSNINAYRLSYFPRTVRVWNLLPTPIISATSLEIFTNLLNKAVQEGSVVVIYPKAVHYISSSPLAVPTPGHPVFVY